MRVVPPAVLFLRSVFRVRIVGSGGLLHARVSGCGSPQITPDACCVRGQDSLPHALSTKTIIKAIQPSMLLLITRSAMFTARQETSKPAEDDTRDREASGIASVVPESSGVDSRLPRSGTLTQLQSTVHCDALCSIVPERSIP